MSKIAVFEPASNSGDASISFVRLRNNFVSVTFAMVETEFAEASQVVKIISGEIEPP